MRTIEGSFPSQGFAPQPKATSEREMEPSLLSNQRVGFTRGVFSPALLPRGAFDFLRWPLVLSFPSFSSLARLSSGVGEMLVSPESDSGCHAGLWSAH